MTLKSKPGNLFVLMRPFDEIFAGREKIKPPEEHGVVFVRGSAVEVLEQGEVMG